jgi:hypothetical protein
MLGFCISAPYLLSICPNKKGIWRLAMMLLWIPLLEMGTASLVPLLITL